MDKRSRDYTQSRRELKEKLRLDNIAKFNEVKKIIQGIEKKCSEANHPKIDNLYSLLTKPALFVQGLGQIKGNKGMATKGTDTQTLDGMKMDRILDICNEMKTNTFLFSPFRRVNIPKPGKKATRPLGIPNLKDKVVQSAIKIILEAIYEPEFERYNLNYGFRPGKSSHDALEKVKYNGTACKYALEGDIVGAFNNVNIKILIRILSKKISDKKFLKLIEQGCYCGLIDKGQYHDTLTGVPQGGIASPVLFNIYMHEFDKFMSKDLNNIVDTNNFETGRKEKVLDPRWVKANGRFQGIRARLKTLLNSFGGVKNLLINGTDTQKENLKSLLIEKRAINLERLKYPNVILSKRKVRFVYCRYADDWILLSNCKLDFITKIKEIIASWLEMKLDLQLSPEKTLITDFLKNERAKFLGFTLGFTLGSYKNVRLTYNRFGNYTKDSGYNIILRMDTAKILNTLALKKFCDKNRNFRPVGNNAYSVLPIRDIINKYNAVQVGLANYYLPYIDRIEGFH